MKEEKILRKVLEDSHSKVTQQRLLVFHQLREDGPHTPVDLAKKLQNKVDRVSIYRILDLFERLGIVRRITIGWKYSVELSEIFLDHHHHIVCLACGKVVAVKESETIEQTINQLANGTGFLVTTHQFELQGYCGRCTKLQKRRSL